LGPFVASWPLWFGATPPSRCVLRTPSTPNEVGKLRGPDTKKRAGWTRPLCIRI